MKFSIRDLLLVTVIVALALGWWVDQRGLRRWGAAIERDGVRAQWEADVLKGELEILGTDVEIGQGSIETTHRFEDGATRSSWRFFKPTQELPDS